jgi:mono/diheme cytochrome c family protein
MKNHPKNILSVIIVLFAFMVANADEGEELFKKTCAPCHTVGQGRLVGPDLKDISQKRDQDWIIAFVQSSQTVINSGDADAVATYNEYNKLLMPDQTLSNGQVQFIISYINNAGSGNSPAENQEAKPDMLANTTSDDVANGLLLFTGRKSLTNGGASCISCHTVKDDRVFSNGTLAKELSETYGIMGSAGVAAILKSPPFPAMGVTYKDNTLTEDEVLSLTAYLKSVSDNHIYQHPVTFGFNFVIGGIVVFIIILMCIIIIYFNRKMGSVNDEIINRQSPVIN